MTTWRDKGPCFQKPPPSGTKGIFRVRSESCRHLRFLKRVVVTRPDVSLAPPSHRKGSAGPRLALESPAARGQRLESPHPHHRLLLPVPDSTDWASGIKTLTKPGRAHSDGPWGCGDRVGTGQDRGVTNAGPEEQLPKLREWGRADCSVSVRGHREFPHSNTLPQLSRERVSQSEGAGGCTGRRPALPHARCAHGVCFTE